jgi:hypothetical protein
LDSRNAHKRVFGAQGRNRTTDTVIFSHVLYQLSYLGFTRPNEVSKRGLIGVRGYSCPVALVERVRNGLPNPGEVLRK